MDFAGINYYAIPLAAILGFAFGGVWYSVLSTPWLDAVGKTADDIKAANAAYPVHRHSSSPSSASSSWPTSSPALSATSARAR